MKKLVAGKDYIGIGGGVLILNDKREILLKKRSAASRNEAGKWEKPGGEVDFGEKSIDTMKRETREEANIEINIWGMFPHSDHILKKEKQHWIALNYLANYKSGKVKNNEPKHCDELRWFSLKNLPKNIAQPTRESIKNYLAGKFIKL